MSAVTSVHLDLAENDPICASEPVRWAADTLTAALQASDISVSRTASEASDFTITVMGPDAAGAAAKAKTAGIELPMRAEAFALFENGNGLIAWGHDARALVYALTELADRAHHADGAEPFAGPLPLVEAPEAKVRSIARLFSSEIEDKPWFRDKAMWTEYLTMLATNRFNRFSLMLGMQYDYPYHNYIVSDVYLHFPYPYLLSLPDYDIKVVEIAEEEREANLEMLRFIGQEAARRGLDFQLGFWAQRYDFETSPNTNYTVTGVTPENNAPYVRDALAALLREVPQITGLTFRIHVEGGVTEGDYGFWETAFSALANAGRPLTIDLHAKGLDERMQEITRTTGNQMTVSPKFLAEHMGLSYHPSAIREREYPPVVEQTTEGEQHTNKEEWTTREQLSRGARRFTRQSYGDLLMKDRDWKVVFRVWPGTQRVLAWGDPALAAGFGRAAGFCGADGIEWMEPLSFKGRQGSGMAGGRSLYAMAELATKHDWQKFAYQYRLWGRLSFSPDAERESWMRYLHSECGSAAEQCEQALASASRILPLVTQTHAPTIANNHYWPEIYSNMSVLTDSNIGRPYAFDMDEPVRFGNAPTFDPQMFANPREYATALLTGESLRSYTPLDVADWLEKLAGDTETIAAQAKASPDYQRPAVLRLLIDARIAAAVGRFFAEKYRSACWTELFIATHHLPARRRAAIYANRARLAWMDAVQASKDVYQPDITFGPSFHLRGSWQERLGEIERELKDLRTVDGGWEAPAIFGTEEAERAMAHLEERLPVTAEAVEVRAPESFSAGSEITIDATLASAGPAQAVLHYRRVNHAERWSSMPMTISGQSATATIPAAETAGDFHLQYYLSILRGRQVTMAPGFENTLANTPYRTIMLA